MSLLNEHLLRECTCWILVEWVYMLSWCWQKLNGIDIYSDTFSSAISDWMELISTVILFHQPSVIEWNWYLQWYFFISHQSCHGADENWMELIPTLILSHQPIKSKTRQKSFSKMTNLCFFMKQMQKLILNVALFVLTPAGCAECLCLCFYWLSPTPKQRPVLLDAMFVGCLCLCFYWLSPTPKQRLVSLDAMFVGCLRLCFYWLSPTPKQRQVSLDAMCVGCLCLCFYWLSCEVGVFIFFIIRC